MEHILRCYGDIYDIEIVRAQGTHLYDRDGRRYVDFEAGVWCTSLGHGHARINKVIHEQIEQVMHLGYRYKHRAVEEAAQAVLEVNNIANGKAVFLSSGSEAVEFGVQAIRRLKERPLLLALKGTYLSAFGSAGMRSSEEWYDLDWTDCRQCSRECGPSCTKLTAIPFERVGGLVFESGSGLVISPPEKLVRVIAGMIEEQGGLILANEITTGFGRTGAWFGYEHYGLKPSMVAMGKGMGNGYPVSAVAMSSNVAKELEQSGLRYAQSHQNDALACAVAFEVIRVMREEGLVDRSAKVGAVLKDQLNNLAKRHACIKEVRGKGLMVAMEFTEKVSRAELGKIHKDLFNSGFLVGYSPTPHFFKFFPALVIDEDSICSMTTELSHLL